MDANASISSNAMLQELRHENDLFYELPGASSKAFNVKTWLLNGTELCRESSTPTGPTPTEVSPLQPQSVKSTNKPERQPAQTAWSTPTLVPEVLVERVGRLETSLAPERGYA